MGTRPFASATVLLVLAGGGLAGCWSPGPPVPGRPAHHAQGGFRNPWRAPEQPGYVAALAERARLACSWSAPPPPPGHVLSRDAAVAGVRAAAGENALTWIGHGTLLLRIAGRTVLIDPVWTKDVTPVPPLGPRRLVPPALPLEALPELDLVLVTHDHFDHLDERALGWLARRGDPPTLVPLGVGPLARRAGLTHVAETDWHERARVGGLEVTFVPALHASGRHLAQDDTLWGGFVLAGGGRRVWVSGDSAFGPHLAAIGARYGPFDLAVLFVGGYAPRHVAGAAHMTPEEWARAAREAQALAVVPVHWGTFALGSEPPYEAEGRLRRAARAEGYADEAIWRLAIGQTRVLP